MMNFNKVVLVGNVGAAPDLRYNAKSLPMVNFSLATHEWVKNEDGQGQEQAVWHTIVAFGPIAERCNKHVGKGDTLLVEGKLQVQNWASKKGEKHKSWQVLANNIVFLPGHKNKNQAEIMAPDHEKASTPTNSDDLPF